MCIIYVYIHTHERKKVSTYACMYVCMCMYVYVCVCMCMYVFVCMCMYMYVCVCMYMCVCTYICIQDVFRG